jgi:hypothetical protein
MSGHFGHPPVQPLTDFGDAVAVFADAAFGSVLEYQYLSQYLAEIRTKMDSHIYSSTIQKSYQTPTSKSPAPIGRQTDSVRRMTRLTEPYATLGVSHSLDSELPRTVA